MCGVSVGRWMTIRYHCALIHFEQIEQIEQITILKLNRLIQIEQIEIIHFAQTN